MVVFVFLLHTYDILTRTELKTVKLTVNCLPIEFTYHLACKLHAGEMFLCLRWDLILRIRWIFKKITHSCRRLTYQILLYRQMKRKQVKKTCYSRHKNIRGFDTLFKYRRLVFRTSLAKIWRKINRLHAGNNSLTVCKTARSSSWLSERLYILIMMPTAAMGFHTH